MRRTRAAEMTETARTDPTRRGKQEVTLAHPYRRLPKRITGFLERLRKHQSEVMRPDAASVRSLLQVGAYRGPPLVPFAVVQVDGYSPEFHRRGQEWCRHYIDRVKLALRAGYPEGRRQPRAAALPIPGGPWRASQGHPSRSRTR
jgi:hypothetical protein